MYTLDLNLIWKRKADVGGFLYMFVVGLCGTIIFPLLKIPFAKKILKIGYLELHFLMCGRAGARAESAHLLY